MLQQAIFALNAQRPQEAERIAGLLVRTDRRNAVAQHVLGSALLMQGRAKEAIAPLEAAARNHHDPKIETLLGLALRRAGRPEDAVSWFERAARRRPAHAPAFLELGCVLAMLRRFDQAIEAFNGGLKVAPAMPELFIQLGYAHLQCRARAEAKAAFARALEISPGAVDALLGMAMVLQGQGELEPAAAHYRRVLMSRPNDAATWLNLGHCLLDLGQRDAGYECFRTAARTDPKRFGHVLGSLVKSSRGRFWLKPSAAAQFLRGTKS